MFLKSIRWRLQIWYGLILMGVLAGFGFTAYQLQRGKQFQRLDGELQRRVGELGNALRFSSQPNRGPNVFPPRERLPGGPPLDDRPDDRDGPPRPRTDRPPEDTPIPGNPGDARPREGFLRAPDQFHLMPRQAALFDETDSNGFYYVVWTRDGKELARSTNAPVEVPLPRRPPSSGPAIAQVRGVFREAFQVTPPGEILLAGRNIAQDLSDLRHTAWRLSGIGGVILLLGLAGGWYITSRAIHPISDISATAVKIASGDLSQRIDASDTDSELGQLAAVLNSSFARLEGAFEEQRQFTSDAAHELRTPVAVVLTQTQTALNRERSAGEYVETIQACQRAAQRMRRLIETLLELARLDAGQEPMKHVPFDLCQTVRDCIHLIQPLADEHQVQIQTDLSPASCKGDPERISQVVTNLLANAIHYNKAQGEVKITASEQSGFVILAVADTGAGITAADLPHIFKRFYRADKSRSGGRSGLGLAISKGIVEAHGGAIEVSSEPGEGSTFTVRLPKNSAPS